MKMLPIDALGVLNNPSKNQSGTSNRFWVMVWWMLVPNDVRGVSRRFSPHYGC